jgi:hypothetical protein
MTWYQYLDENPTNGLPSRIRIKVGIDSGLTKTNLQELSEVELNSLGFVSVEDPPNYNNHSQDLVWHNDSKSWSITTTTDLEKISYAWDQNEYYKNNLKIKLYERITPYVQNGGMISTNFYNAIKILDNINEENCSDPFSFNWQHPSLLGYTPEVVSGISSTEYSLINYALVDFINEIYIPNQKY